MAKFSQGLLQGLMQPAFGQNLYQVGRAAAAGPSLTRASQRMQEEREQTQRDVTGGLFGLEQAAAEGRDYQEDVGSLVGLGATPEQIAQAEQRGQVKRQATVKQQQAEQSETTRQNLVTSAKTKANQQGKDQSFLDALDSLDAKSLRDYLMKDVEPETFQVAPGGVIVKGGKVIFRNPFKPESAPVPKINLIETDDEVLVYEGTELKARTPINKKNTQEQEAARIDVISSTMTTKQTIKDAKRHIKENMGTGGFVGGVSSFIPGTPSYELANNYYTTISGKEAFREIDQLRQQAEKYGSRGTGLGQITQIEFSALKSNIAGLNAGLSDEMQLESLDKIERNLNSIGRIATGESIIDVIDFNQETYVEAGYEKVGNVLFYFPTGPAGKGFKFNPETDKFEEL
jgi:hypothetical protein